MKNSETFFKILKEYQSKNKALFEKLEKIIRAEPYMEDIHRSGTKMFEFGFDIYTAEPKNFEKRYCLEVVLEKLFEKGVIEESIAQFKSYEWCRISNFNNMNGIFCIPTLDREILLVYHGATEEPYYPKNRTSYEIDRIPEAEFDRILNSIIDYNRGIFKKNDNSFFIYEPLPISVTYR